MTKEEQDKQLGEILVELRATKKEFDAVKVKAERLGDILIEIGKTLKSYPELIDPLPKLGSIDYREMLKKVNQSEVEQVAAEIR